MPKATLLAGSMTAEQFDAIAARFAQMSARGKALARRVLVDGLSIADAAREFGLSRERGTQCVRKFDNALYPADWVSAVVRLPPALMLAVQEMEKEALAKWRAERAAVLEKR
ncbi:MAG: TrfB-related DNA-binding protein [Betaproteobacteria bacterium]|nr:TrfB-related DNA-binding protein [Betaproteobacteria bacterium]